MRLYGANASDFTKKTEANNCIWLLKEIKAVTLQSNEKRNGFLALLDARTNFLNCKQAVGQSANEYLKALKGWSDTIEYQGGTVAENPSMIPSNDKQGVTRTLTQRTSIARDRTLAIALIRGADQSRYGTLITELANQYAMGRDTYPTDLTAAHALLVNYRTPSNAAPRGRPSVALDGVPEAGAMTFTQQGVVAGRNGAVQENITCFNCQSQGHYASNCPAGDSGVTNSTILMQYAYMITQAGAVELDPDWILLDSQCTVLVIKNPKMLTNIRASPFVLQAFTNGGYQDSAMVGDFPNLGQVWYNQQSIANILSLADVQKVCQVTMDTAKEPALLVHRLNGSLMTFDEHPSGLYIFKPTTNTTVNAYNLLHTIAAQKKMFTKREVAAADAACALYRHIGRPDESEFLSILTKNLIRNCPVTPDNAQRALLIYGPRRTERQDQPGQSRPQGTRI